VASAAPHTAPTRAAAHRNLLDAFSHGQGTIGDGRGHSEGLRRTCENGDAAHNQKPQSHGEPLAHECPSPLAAGAAMAHTSMVVKHVQKAIPWERGGGPPFF